MTRKTSRAVTRSVDFQLDSDATTNSDGRTLDGYAAVFNQPTHIRSYEGDFHETIAPGAFQKTLSERKPVMQYNHGKDARIGSAPIGTFDSITEDGHGLKVTGRLFDHPDVERVRQGIESGDIRGMSFTFNVMRDEWTDKSGSAVSGRELERLLYTPGDRGPLNRNIKEIKLMEAGPVLYPAYEGTSVGVRSAEELEEPERQEIIESYCRTAGLELDDVSERVDALVAAGGSRPVIEDKLRLGQSIDELEERVTHQLAELEHTTGRADALLADVAEDVTAAWLNAENTYRWLEAEAEFKTSESDAAIRTSDTEIPDSADSKVTLSQPISKTKTGKRMSTLTEMRERIAAIEVRMEALNTEYRDAAMPETEDAEYTEIVAERSTLLETIDKVQARLDAYAELAKSKPEAVDKKGAPAVHTRDTKHDLTEIRNSVYTEDGYRDAVRDHALRFVDSKEFKPAGKIAQREDAQQNVEELLDLPGRDAQGHTIGERILTTSSDLYERAFFKAAAAGSAGVLEPEERASLQLGSDTAGGYAIPVQLDSTVMWTNAGVINPLRQLARVERIVGKEWQGVTSAGTTVSRHDEGAESAEASFTLGQVTVRTQRVDGFTPFTFEAEIGWGAIRNSIAHALSNAKDAEEASAFLLGDGTDVSGAPKANGLLGTLSGNTVQTGTTLVLTDTDLFNLENALDARYQANASIMGHKAIFNNLRQLTGAQYAGSQLWERVGNGLPDQLLGYSIYRHTSMVSANAVGAKLLVLGDFSNFLIVDRIGMNAEIVPHIFGTNGRPTGQRGIFSWWMNNSKILVPGAFKVLVGK